MDILESDPLFEEAFRKIQARILKAIADITGKVNKEPHMTTIHNIGELCYIAHQLEDIADNLHHRGKWAIL